MHKDVAKALEEADGAVKAENVSLNMAARAIGRAYLFTFLRNLPNSTDTANGLALWYPTRILVELTEEDPTK